MTCHTHMLDKIHQIVASRDKTKILADDTIVTNVHLKTKGYVGKAVIEGKKISLRQFSAGIWVPA